MSELIKISEYEVTDFIISSICMGLFKKTYSDGNVLSVIKEHHNLKQTIVHSSGNIVVNERTFVAVEVCIDVSIVKNTFNKYVSNVSISYKKVEGSDNIKFDNDKIVGYIKSEFEKRLK